MTGCVQERGRERNFINWRDYLFLYPWQQDIPLLIFALLLLITLRATDCFCLVYFSVASPKQKEGKKRGRSASCNYNFSFWGRRLTAVSPSSLTPPPPPSPLHACTLARNNEPYIHRPTRWALINCHRYRRYIYNPKLWLHSKSARVKLEGAKCFCLPVWHYECCHFLSLTAVWSCCMLSDVPGRISMWAFFVLFLCFFP